MGNEIMSGLNPNLKKKKGEDKSGLDSESQLKHQEAYVQKYESSINGNSISISNAANIGTIANRGLQTSATQANEQLNHSSTSINHNNNNIKESTTTGSSKISTTEDLKQPKPPHFNRSSISNNPSLPQQSKIATVSVVDMSSWLKRGRMNQKKQNSLLVANGFGSLGALDKNVGNLVGPKLINNNSPYKPYSRTKQVLYNLDSTLGKQAKSSLSGLLTNNNANNATSPNLNLKSELGDFLNNEQMESFYNRIGPVRKIPSNNNLSYAARKLENLKSNRPIAESHQLWRPNASDFRYKK